MNADQRLSTKVRGYFLSAATGKLLHVDSYCRTPDEVQATKEYYPQHRVLRRYWDQFAWPGGYPIWYRTKDSGTLCAGCANKNLKLTLGDDPQWRIIYGYVDYCEGLEYCDHCGRTNDYEEPSDD